MFQNTSEVSLILELRCDIEQGVFGSEFIIQKCFVKKVSGEGSCK